MVDHCVALDRERVEGDLSAGERLCLWQESKNIPTAIDHNIFLCDVEKCRELADIAEDPLTAELRDHTCNKCLLAMGAIKVAIGQSVTLANEHQCLNTGNSLRSSREDCA